MKTAALALFFCAVFVAADASFLEHIFNYTKWNGKLNYNTDKGLDVGYKGGLKFDNDIIKVDLLNIGGHFKAAPEDTSINQLGNKTKDAISYAGGFNVEQGGYKAHVATSGIAGYNADINVQQDNATNSTLVNYTKKIGNIASWNATSGDYFAAGEHNGTFAANGQLLYRGDKIDHQQNIQGAGIVKGRVTYLNGTDIGNFTAIKNGQANIAKVITWNGDQETEEDDHHKPNGTFIGKANFAQKGLFQWNNDTVVGTKQGLALFGGEIFVKKSDENNTWGGILVHKKGAYKYDGQWGKNGVRDGVVKANGEFDGYHGLAGKHDNETTEIKAAHIANVTHHYQIKLDKEESAKVEVLIEDDLSTPHLRGYSKKVVDGHFNASVKAGAHILLNHTEGNVTIVNGKTGSAWDVVGNDSAHGDWNTTGNRTADFEFIVKPLRHEVENINVKVGHTDNGIIEKLNFLAKKFEQMNRK
jgi:hypothetical protein